MDKTMDKEMSFWIKLVAGIMIFWGMVIGGIVVRSVVEMYVKFGSIASYMNYYVNYDKSRYIADLSGAITGLIYLLSGIFILKRKRWARILSLYNSAILLGCYIVIVIRSNNDLGAAFAVFYLFPIALIPLFLFLMLRWKRMKEQFK